MVSSYTLSAMALKTGSCLVVMEDVLEAQAIYISTSGADFFSKA